MLVVRLVGCVAVAAASPTAGSRPAGCARASSRSRSLASPAALDGLRIGHLSDFHLGAPLSRGNSASARAVEWVAARSPDLVCVTGDLVSHPRGERRLRRSAAEARANQLVVLGNHDVAVTRDPFSRAAELRDLEQARLLRDEAVVLDIRDERSSSSGSIPGPTVRSAARPHDARRRRARAFGCSSVTFRRDRRPGAARLVRPDPRGPPARWSDLPAAPGSSHHARPSPGAIRLGPLRDRGRASCTCRRAPARRSFRFRFFARPEVTELVLRRL